MAPDLRVDFGAAAASVVRKSYVIHVQKIKGLRYRRVEVAVNGRTARVVTGRRLRTPVDLVGLPKGTYTVLITVQTTSGQTLHGTRTYHTWRTPNRCRPAGTRSSRAQPPAPRQPAGVARATRSALAR